ncbi:hypothetical protein, partial [Maridesulfovibrio ferrireducens]|uniref:hypothetical protein n=1 Tax=Maridesulfovibrio ferrireducens TaxID=246191 RepID=UPI001A234E38
MGNAKRQSNIAYSIPVVRCSRLDGYKATGELEVKPIVLGTAISTKPPIYRKKDLKKLLPNTGKTLKNLTIFENTLFLSEIQKKEELLHQLTLKKPWKKIDSIILQLEEFSGTKDILNANEKFMSLLNQLENIQEILQIKEQIQKHEDTCSFSSLDYWQVKSTA